MNFKRTCYIVFVFILCTIFNMEVKAVVADQESAASSMKDLVCLYYDNESAYQLQIFNKYGVILYEPVDGKKSTVISEAGVVSWNGQWEHSKKDLKLYQDGKAVNLAKTFTSCPDAIIKRPASLTNWGQKILIVEKYDEPLELKKNDSIIEYKDQMDGLAGHTSSDDVNDDYENISTSCDNVENIKENWLNKNLDDYHASCLYSYDAGNQCILVQLDISSNGKIEVSRNGEGSIDGIYKELDSSFNDNYIKENGGWCPNLWIKKQTEAKTQNDVYTTLSMNPGKKDVWRKMNIVNQAGKNYVDSTKEMTDYNYEDYNLGFIDMRGEKFSCSDLLDEDGDLVSLLHMLLVMVKIIVPIIIIVLGSLDFGTAIFAGDESNMKKAQAKFIKRLVVGVAIFLVPSLLKLLLTIGNSVWSIIDADLCGIL